MNKSDTTVSSLSSSYSGSSNTNSSGTRSEQVQKETDFTKDNTAGPLDLECHIQAERITKMLDEAVYKTKICLVLPQLVQEKKTLAASMHSQHLDEILFIYEQYENPLFSTSLLNFAAMEDIENGDMSLKHRLNPELGHMIYILYNYANIKAKVEELVTKMKRIYLGDSNKKEIPVALLYLLELEHFREQMIVQMEIVAADELKARFKTRKLEESNKKLEAQIQDYSSKLKDETEAFNEEMEIKHATIVRLEEELKVYEDNADLKLKKQILDSERQMVLLSRVHKIKDEILREEQIDTSNSYETLLRNNLLLEKNQRARRIKVETQLLSWVQKYDTEMRDKQVDLDELVRQFDEEEEKVEKLEIQLAEQDKEFMPLMEEREVEYHQEMTEKMTLFLVEHAARVIQVAWRDTLANRAEKKKLKKLQKKLIAQQEAAERAAEAAARKAAAEARKAEKEAKRAEKEAKKQEKLAAIQAKKEEAAAAKKK